ncbi:MAG: transporter, partial [Chloroflexi bacterium RBG_16_47_49]
MTTTSTQASQNHASFRYLDIITALFVTVLVVSNIASSAKIVDWGFEIGGVRLAFDAGTLLFPVSYIFGDILTEVYGYKRSRRVIWTGFLCLGLSALVFWLVRLLPGESTWQGYAGQDAYNAILGGMSSGGIVLASLLGYWTGEFSNSFTLAKMKIITRGRWLWSRTISSTLVGELVDTLIFILIASLFKVFPWSLF